MHFGIIKAVKQKLACLPGKISWNKKVSCRKHIARQHSCYKFLCMAGGVVDPAKFRLI